MALSVESFPNDHVYHRTVPLHTPDSVYQASDLTLVTFDTIVSSEGTKEFVNDYPADVILLLRAVLYTRINAANQTHASSMIRETGNMPKGPFCYQPLLSIMKDDSDHPRPTANSLQTHGRPDLAHLCCHGCT